MPSIVSNRQTEAVLRTVLEAEGYALSPKRAQGENGTDVLALRGEERFDIEVIGFKSNAPTRSSDFYQVFFRAVSRLDSGATACVVALPTRFGRGLPRRASQHAVAWERIGNAFPELQIWLVDTDAGSIERTGWCDWLAEPGGR